MQKKQLCQDLLNFCHTPAYRALPLSDIVVDHVGKIMTSSIRDDLLGRGGGIKPVRNSASEPKGEIEKKLYDLTFDLLEKLKNLEETCYKFQKPMIQMIQSQKDKIKTMIQSQKDEIKNHFQSMTEGIEKDLKPRVYTYVFKDLSSRCKISAKKDMRYGLLDPVYTFTQQHLINFCEEMLKITQPPQPIANSSSPLTNLQNFYESQNINIDKKIIEAALKKTGGHAGKAKQIILRELSGFT